MSTISAVEGRSPQFNPIVKRKPRQRLFSRESLTTLRRAISGLDDSELDAGDAASTLFRFFRSCHVVDLKLFLSLAIIFLCVHFGIILLFFVIKPAYHLMVGGFQAYGGVKPAIVHCVNVVTTSVVPALIKYGGPAIPVCGAIVAWAYLSAATRLGVVDLFACEIRTLCRVGTAFDIGRLYVARRQSLIETLNATKKHAALESPAEPAEKTNPAEELLEQPKGFSSEEQYCPVFTSNSNDLEALEALVVGYITEFYTYMKAARDLQRSLAENPSPKAAIPILENLIYVLFLGYESARKAIEDQIEYEPTRAENMIVILTTELECYWFLCKHFEDKKDELRAGRLNLRRQNYMTEIPDLFCQLEASHGKNEEDWKLARNTTSELKSRYERTFGETMAAAMARRRRECAAGTQSTP
jgi:hypothetical protein